MSADFWAGYISGALGIVAGNPLDILKVRLQAGQNSIPAQSPTSRVSPSWFRGAAAPVLGYGALNSLLFVTYNGSLKILDSSISDPTKLNDVALAKIWFAGALGGLATWVVSAPSELVKCRAQLSVADESSSLAVLKGVWRSDGLKGLYLGGIVTGLRDSVGYGFYFWSYELSKMLLTMNKQSPNQEAPTATVLISGGVAGVITWASVYPLDVIKTRIQTQDLRGGDFEESGTLLSGNRQRVGAVQITRELYRSQRLQAFYRGLGICSVRAFVVNAIQWYTYERAMSLISSLQRQRMPASR